MSVDYISYDDYTAENDTEDTASGHGYDSSSQLYLTHVLVGLNILITAVGLAGNSLVIWICGCKMKRTVVNTWYLSLAVSDLLFCAFLPLDVFYMITSHWPFGLLLCKLVSSLLSLNMYSSVFLLVLISTDRCIMTLFPIWCHNHRKVRRAYGAVLLMWLLSALLTLPSLIFKETAVRGSVTQCYSSYRDESRHKAVVVTRLICGFVIPFLMIVTCCSVLCVKLGSMTVKSNKPYKIMGALIFSFFCCWVPYHTFILLELDVKNHSVDLLQTGLKVGATLAASNSCISPFLYVFIGNDFKKTLKRSLISRMDVAMAEDLRTGGFSNSRSRTLEVL